MDSNAPEATDANSKAAAAPAPIPMRTIRIIASCPALSAVRDGSCPSQPSAPAVTGDRQGPGLADNVGQQPKKPRTLDFSRQLTLLLRGDCRDPAWHDFSPFGNVALQQLDVFVVDLRCICAGERACLAAAEEGAARASGLGETHRSDSLLATISISSPPSRSSRGPRPSRSRPRPPRSKPLAVAAIKAPAITTTIVTI